MNFSPIEQNEPKEDPSTLVEGRQKRLLLFVYFPIVLLVFLIAATLISEKFVRGIDVLFAIAANIAAFAWIRIDSRERRYPLHRLFPYAVVIFGTLALFYYIFRSRGFVDGMSAMGWLVFYLVCLVLACAVLMLVVLLTLALSGVLAIE